MLELVELLFDQCRLVGFRIQRYVDQGQLLAVAQLTIGYDMSDCRQCLANTLPKPLHESGERLVALVALLEIGFLLILFGGVDGRLHGA